MQLYIYLISICHFEIRSSYKKKCLCPAGHLEHICIIQIVTLCTHQTFFKQDHSMALDFELLFSMTN